jgi:hypothetical protein
MSAFGSTTFVWDLWARGIVGRWRVRWRSRRSVEATVERPAESENIVGQAVTSDSGTARDVLSRRSGKSTRSTTSIPLHNLNEEAHVAGGTLRNQVDTSNEDSNEIPDSEGVIHTVPVKIGIGIIVAFFGMYTVLLYFLQ